ncbi:hypothetical protein U1Q18_033261, partial [Sarracenia purpurea var. burkii]
HGNPLTLEPWPFGRSPAITTDFCRSRYCCLPPSIAPAQDAPASHLAHDAPPPSSFLCAASCSPAPVHLCTYAVEPLHLLTLCNITSLSPTLHVPILDRAPQSRRPRLFDTLSRAAPAYSTPPAR